MDSNSNRRQLITPGSPLRMKTPLRVAVTGAAGQIGYSLLFRIASGEMLGEDQPVILQMLEIPDEKAQAALKGVMMELDDCAFPLLAGMIAASDPKVAFRPLPCQRASIQQFQSWIRYRAASLCFRYHCDPD